MSVVGRTIRNAQSFEKGALALLRLQKAAVHLALLEELFGGEQKIRTQSDVLERLSHLIEEVQEIPESEDYIARGTDAEAVLKIWIDQELVGRTFPEGESEEVCELLTAGHRALQIMATQESRRLMANESRLGMLTDHLVRLAEDTDPHPHNRIKAKYEEIERLRREIDDIEAGRTKSLDERQGLDRFDLIMEEASNLTADFQQVRANLEEVTGKLYEAVRNEGEGRGQVVSEILRGINAIAQSDAGKTAEAFFALLSNVGETTRLKDAIGQILSRPFMGKVSDRQQAMLRRLPKVLTTEGGRNQAVMTELGKRLHAYIMSREYKQHRELKALMTELHDLAKESASLAVKMPKFNLHLTKVGPGYITKWKLVGPGVSSPMAKVALAEGPAVPMSEILSLYRDADIDWISIRAMIQRALARGDGPSIGQIIAHEGCPQGLATIMGLIHEAARHGMGTEGEEEVRWTTADGTHVYRGNIPHYIFLRKDPSHD